MFCYDCIFLSSQLPLFKYFNYDVLHRLKTAISYSGDEDKIHIRKLSSPTPIVQGNVALILSGKVEQRISNKYNILRSPVDKEKITTPLLINNDPIQHWDKMGLKINEKKTKVFLHKNEFSSFEYFYDANVDYSVELTPVYNEQFNDEENDDRTRFEQQNNDDVDKGSTQCERSVKSEKCQDCVIGQTEHKQQEWQDDCADCWILILNFQTMVRLIGASIIRDALRRCMFTLAVMKSDLMTETLTDSSIGLCELQQRILAKRITDNCKQQLSIIDELYDELFLKTIAAGNNLVYGEEANQNIRWFMVFNGFLTVKPLSNDLKRDPHSYIDVNAVRRLNLNLKGQYIKR